MALDILSNVVVDGTLTATNVSGTNTGDQTITLTGDITGSGTGSFATAIAAGAIVNADINAAAAIELSKLAEAVIQADGGQAFTANQPMGGFKFTGAAAATGNGEFLRYNELGAASGIASLDGGGKIPAAQLPNTVMEYQGNWVASTNTPALADGVGNAGDVYRATDAGTVDFGAGNITFAAGDFAIYSGSIWEKSLNSNAVVSVFSRTGAVVAANGDYTAAQVTNVPAGNLAAVTVQAALDELQTDINSRATTAGTLAQFGATTSAELAGVLSDETGSAGGGIAVFNNAPVLIAPDLGTPSALVGTNITGTAASLTAGLVTSIGNLTGEVTSTNRATVLDKTAITGKTAVTAASGDYVLISDVSDSDNLKKVLVSDFTTGNVQRFSASFGDTAAFSFTIAHGLTGSDLMATVRRVSDGEVVLVETKLNATNVIVGPFNTAPGNDEFRVTVLG